MNIKLFSAMCHIVSTPIGYTFSTGPARAAYRLVASGAGRTYLKGTIDKGVRITGEVREEGVQKDKRKKITLYPIH